MTKEKTARHAIVAGRDAPGAGPETQPVGNAGNRPEGAQERAVCDRWEGGAVGLGGLERENGSE